MMTKMRFGYSVLNLVSQMETVLEVADCYSWGNYVSSVA